MEPETMSETVAAPLSLHWGQPHVKVAEARDTRWLYVKTLPSSGFMNAVVSPLLTMGQGVDNARVGPATSPLRGAPQFPCETIVQ